MRRTRGSTAPALAGGLLVMALLGCSDSTDPGGTALEAAEADDAALVLSEEVDQAVAALSLEGAVTGTVELDGTGLRVVGPVPRGAGCAEVTGGEDSDGDGAPDEATYTITLPACRFTGFRGGTLEITGIIVLSDPTPTSPDFAYQAELDDFRWSYTNPDATRSYTAVRNGTRVLTGNAAGLSLTNTVTLVRSFATRPETTIQHNLLLSFTPAAGQSLVRGEPLPDGTITKSGTLIWSRNGRSRTFTVTTVVPLVWDSTCPTHRKIVAGEIRASLADGSYVRTVWTGCGEEPVRELVRPDKA